MTKDEKYSIAKWAMDHAVQNGAQQARVSIYNNNSSQIEVRDEKIDKLQESNRNGMQINLYVDNKYSSISTNRITNKEELGKFIEEAIAGTRYLAEDEFRTLPDPERYYKGGRTRSEDCRSRLWLSGSPAEGEGCFCSGKGGSGI